MWIQALLFRVLRFFRGGIESFWLIRKFVCVLTNSAQFGDKRGTARFFLSTAQFIVPGIGTIRFAIT